MENLDRLNIKPKIKILVAGAGSIGRRHIKNLIKLGVDVSVWRRRSDLARQLEREFPITVFTDLDEAIARADAVVVATATDDHLFVINKAVNIGKPMFIEKPIAQSIDGLEEVGSAIKRKKLVVEVGFQLRKHPNLIALSELLSREVEGPIYTFRAAVGHRLDKWRSGVDYRSGYSADSTRGGGALMDLIHELDLVQWQIGNISRVTGSLAKLSEQQIKGDDLTNLTVECVNGAIGQVQMDMLSPIYRRNFEVICRDAIYKWDYVLGTLSKSVKDDWVVIHRVKNNFVKNDMFMEHMKHFLSRLSDDTIPALCEFDEGVRVLRAALTAKRSSGSWGAIVSEAGIV